MSNNSIWLTRQQVNGNECWKLNYLITYKKRRRKLISDAFWVYSVLRQNFEPIAVRVLDEIDTHFRVLKADTAHFFVLFMCRVKIICFKCQMKFTFAQIVRLRMFFKPSELKLKIAWIIAQINDNKIVGGFSSDLVQIQNFKQPLNFFNSQAFQIFISSIVILRQTCAVLPKAGRRFIAITIRYANHHTRPCTS